MRNLLTISRTSSRVSWCLRASAPILILITCSGCLDALVDQLPHINGTWAGTIEPVQVHDTRGRSHQAAALRITEGPIPDWNVPEGLGGGHMPLLAHDDGVRIMLASELPVNRSVRVKGVMVVRDVGNPFTAEKNYSDATVSRDLDLPDWNRWDHIIIVEGSPKALDRTEPD